MCASELRWDTGKTYEFEYQGRMLTGLPELSTYYAGMGLNCKVLLQVLGGNKFAMQVKEAKYTRVNQVLR